MAGEAAALFVVFALLSLAGAAVLLKLVWAERDDRETTDFASAREAARRDRRDDRDDRENRDGRGRSGGRDRRG